MILIDGAVSHEAVYGCRADELVIANDDECDVNGNNCGCVILIIGRFFVLRQAAAKLHVCGHDIMED